MEELAVWYGIPVAMVMLGVPLWRSIEECRQGRLVQMHLLRWWITCSLILLFSFFLAVTFSTLEFVLYKTLVSETPPIPTECTILSKGVDLRYSRICELKDLSQMQLKVWGIGARRKPPCHLDYYWTSILKVEFAPGTSSSPLTTFTEVPKRALPLHCRPGFTVIWRMTRNFEINSTYSCMYMPGRSKSISILEDLESKCVLERTSTFKLLQEFVVVHSEVLVVYLRKFSPLLWETLYSILLGIFYSMTVTIITSTICVVYHRVFDYENDTTLDILYFKARLQLACLIVTLMFGAIWFGCQNEDVYSGIQLLVEVASDTFASTKQSKLSEGDHD
ncbi:hypothetical protein O6H91_12G039100 [Diphasiastrum complanatum]|uniref:Uncharacterized protein n=1 Tax=Diphasiastrum complanatum TaxID=34168 RepID=A0ACC2C0L5_DIPCM|nr:hypothetical protein O6H91_12G039100 [Diphasiastrum complanatum]